MNRLNKKMTLASIFSLLMLITVPALAEIGVYCLQTEVPSLLNDKNKWVTLNAATSPPSREKSTAETDTPSKLYAICVVKKPVDPSECDIQSNAGYTYPANYFSTITDAYKIFVNSKEAFLINSINLTNDPSKCTLVQVLPPS